MSKYILKVVPVMVLVLCVRCGETGKSDFSSVVRSHIRSYPEMQVQDLYKLVFQATMGNAHYLSDTARVLTYLRDELEEVNPSRKQPLLRNITPDGRTVRLNLAPFKARGGDLNLLAEVMFVSATQFTRTSAQLRRYWHIIETMAKHGDLPFSADSLSVFYAEMDAMGYPAVHHSDVYTAKYAPHYRVVLRSELSRLQIHLDE